MVRSRQSRGEQMPSAHSNGHAPESRQGAVRPYEGKGPCAHVEVAGEPGVGAGTPSKRVARAKPSGDAGKADSPFRMAERLRAPQGEGEGLRRESEVLSEVGASFAGRQPQAAPRRGRSSRSCCPASRTARSPGRAACRMRAGGGAASGRGAGPAPTPRAPRGSRPGRRERERGAGGLRQCYVVSMREPRS